MRYSSFGGLWDQDKKKQGSPMVILLMMGEEATET